MLPIPVLLPLSYMMPSLGEDAVLAVVVLIIIGVLFNRRGQQLVGRALVLREFTVNDSAAAGSLVRITGRRSGVVAWLLTAIGIDSEFTLTVNDDEISFKAASLSGQVHRVVPLPNVSSTECGYHKPIFAMICGVISAVTGLVLYASGSVEGLIIGAIIAVILLAAYWLSKSMRISIETVGGSTIGMQFKTSVLEGVAVDIRKVLQTVRLINGRVVASQGRINSV